jgi:NitT/TauT family transport system permease protein
MTSEHINYLKKLKVKKMKIILGQISIIVLLITLWQLLTNCKLIDSFIFSSPIKIMKTIVLLSKDKMLFTHIFTTLYEVLISFIISMILSILLASLLWYFPQVAKILDPYLTIINSLPKVALGPIILIWFGTNIKSIIIMGILISVIVLTINIYNGFNNVDKNKIKLINSITKKRWYLYKYLVLPSNIENIISNLKICISMSLIGIIMGEFLVSKQGIGYLILYGSQVFNLDLVMTGIFLLCILATTLYYIVYYLEIKYKKNKRV